MTDKPISPEVLREVEKMFRCTCNANFYAYSHSDYCAGKHRPAVARAIQDREDRLAEAAGHMKKLIEVVREIEPLHVEDPSSYPCEICDAVRASQAFLNSLGKRRASQGQTISDDERAKVRAAALEEAAKIVEGQCLIYMAKVHTDEEATALVNELCQDKADIIRSLIDKPDNGEVG